jgi:hypothetical protein
MTDWQAWVVAIVVPLATAHAGWALIGPAGRRRLTRWLAAAPLPQRWRQRLQRAPAGGDACGCDGCGASNASASRPVVVKLHRRPR